MAAKISSKFNVDNCIEKAFFRYIIAITLVTCIATMLFDILVVGKLATTIHLTALCILTLLTILFAVNKVPFQITTAVGLFILNSLFTYRGLVTSEFNQVTCTIIITLGFVNALVSRNLHGKILTVTISISLLAMLFKDYQTIPAAKLIRQAIPYCCVYFIVTVCSSFLKNKYERNQRRLRKMVRLLNQKNRKINEQNELLRKNFSALEDLNQNLERIINKKTAKIKEKNKQLSDIAYANAHTIRGPLARILGLLNLKDIDPQNKDFYICKIYREARDMDDTLIAMTRQIEANIIGEHTPT